MAQSKKKSKTATTKSEAKTKKTTSPPLRVRPRELKPQEKRFPFNRFPFKKRQKPPRIKYEALPSSFKVLWRSLEILREHWDLFLGILVIYGVVNIILVKGFATGLDLSSIKSAVSGTFHGHLKDLGTSTALFVYLLGGTGNSSNAAAGAYQSFLIIVTSLTLIWAMRQVYAGVKVGIRESYYKACYPLVPICVVILIIAVQIIPFVIGAGLFSAVVGGGIANSIPEEILTGIICLGLVILSLRWLSSSLFALYIVTLPDMTPLKALRSARDLVRFRRLEIFRKILFLPIAILFIFAVIMTPIILFVTVVAAWAFFILTMLGLAIFHSYMYTCYREML